MLKYLLISSSLLLTLPNVARPQNSVKANADFLTETKNSSNISEKQEWQEIEDILRKYAAVYNGVNDKVTSTGMPDGPLAGNGNVGLVSTISKDWSRFYLTTNGFWTGKKFEVKPLPIGGVDIVINGSSAEGLSQVQNMLDAEINSTMNGKSLKIRTWVSATGDYLISEISTSAKKPINISVETWTTNTNNKIYPVAKGLEKPNVVWASRETEGGEGSNWVCRAALATKIIGTNYTTAVAENNKGISKFILKPGETITVVTCIIAGKDISDHVEKAVAAVKDQTKATLDAMHTTHLAWWKNYWLKSFVRTYDPQLERFYFGALYEAACAYRNGSVCPALYGPWVTTDFPNWNGNYTLSYNHQASVVGFASSNRPELLFPYMQQRYDWEPEAKRRAERGDINFIVGNRWSDKFKNGSSGILEPITEGPWGSCAEDLYMGMISGSVWGSLPICWYVNYTRDYDYLSKTAYPYLNEVAKFWESYLVKEDGKWVVKYAGDREWYNNDDINSAMDNAVVRSFFKNMINYSKELDVDKDRRILWEDIVKNMTDLPHGNILGRPTFYEYNNGPIKEGDWPGLVMIAGHANAVTLGSDNEIRQTFINTIDVFNSWETPNAPGFLWASAIKGGYPAEALLDRFHYLLKTKMRRNYTIPTGGHGTESISSLDYINGMMLQSDEGFIRIFPKFVGDSAKFVRLRASGAFLVSARLDKKNIENLQIFSEKGGKCLVLNPWGDGTVSVTDQNKKTIPISIETGKIAFETIAGNTYFLSSLKKSDQRPVQTVSKNDVQIGAKIWLAKNLDVNKFRNGDIIPQAATDEEWQKANSENKPAWSYYKNDKDNGVNYGKLYNWWAVKDERGLAPTGYHIPDIAEVMALADSLGERETAGAKLKNGSFKAAMGGYRSEKGVFRGINMNGYFWTSSFIFSNVVSNMVLSEENAVVYFNYSRFAEGLSVRCVKD